MYAKYENPNDLHTLPHHLQHFHFLSENNKTYSCFLEYQQFT